MICSAVSAMADVVCKRQHIAGKRLLDKRISEFTAHGLRMCWLGMESVNGVRSRV